MTEANELTDQFLLTADLDERLALLKSTVDGKPPDEAVSVVGSALSLATDYARFALEIAKEHLGAEVVAVEMHRRLQQRSADYVNHQFHSIIDRLDGGII